MERFVVSEDIVANFSIDNPQIEAEFDVSEGTQFNALFSIDSQLQVQGSGVIDVTTSGGVAVVTSTTYIHEQGIASDTWVIEHNLNKRPSVTVVDTADTVFTAQVEYNSDNQCTIYINGATKGKAYLN